jgi:TATA-binding protein-associated factor
VLLARQGLGKTLQATAILACSISQQRAAAGATNPTAAAAAAGGAPPVRPSLVVCPSTLVAHWAHEIGKYVAPEALRPLVILGPPSERAAAQKQLPDHDVAIMSYEALRSDAAWAAAQQWDYVILDEGHVIRNPKSKLAAAVKRLAAQHRLVLSGTPIQNSALELWGLFDFLMPGLLGGGWPAELGGTLLSTEGLRCAMCTYWLLHHQK